MRSGWQASSSGGGGSLNSSRDSGRPREWVCKGCGTSNFATKSECRSCGSRADDGAAANLPGSLRTSSGAASFEEQWRCPKDSSLNFMDRMTCRRCGEKRPEQARPVFKSSGPGAPETRPEWRCSCGVSNFCDRDSCRGCKQRNPTLAVKPDAPEWICRSCNASNFVTRGACRVCSAHYSGPPLGDSEPISTRSPSSLIRTPMNRSGIWQRQEVEATPVAPPPSAQAVEDIQRVDRQLAELDEEIAQLRIRRAHDKAGSMANEKAIVDPEVMVEKIYRENAAKLGLSYPPAEEPDGLFGSAAAAISASAAAAVKVEASAGSTDTAVPPAATTAAAGQHAVQTNQPNTYEIVHETAARHEKNQSWIRAEVRRRKMIVYHRMRQTGEHMAKLVEMANENVEQFSALNPGHPRPDAPIVPGGLFRLRTHQRSHDSDKRWDSSLAPEVDMVWDRDVLNYAFDDQTQRVHDPEAENRERRAALRWTPEEQEAFVEAYREYGKEFHVIATKKPFRVSEMAPKTTHEIIAFYYHIKHRIELRKLMTRRGAASLLTRSGPRDGLQSSSGGTPMPRELLELGITSESALVAYLKAQNESQERPAAAPAAAQNASAAVPPATLPDEQRRDDEAGQKRVKEEGAHGDGASKRAKGSDDGDDMPAAVSITPNASFSNQTLSAGVATAGLDSSDDADGGDDAPAGDDDMPEVDLEGFSASDHATDWSALELGIMREALREFGPAFERVSQQVGKTPDQCKACYALNETRFQRLLRRQRVKPLEEAGEWSDDEKVLFRQVVMNHGCDWAALTASFPGKSEAACRALWRKYKWRLGLQEALRSFAEQQQQQQQARSDEEPRAKLQKTIQ